VDDPVFCSKVILRHAVEKDLQFLEWGGEYKHFRGVYRDVYQSSLTGKAIIWIAEIADAGIIGQAFVSLNGSRQDLSDGVDRAYIYGFRVKPVYRSRGVGASMLRKIEADLESKGFSCVTLNVARENKDAQKLYERMGFIIVAEEPGRWSYIDHLGKRQEVCEPAWRMEKSLRD